MPDYNPYDELYGILEASKPKPITPSQERMKQITRTNVYGEGLRALSEAITGSMGANIQRRELPKTSVMALNRYYQDDADYKQREDIYNHNRLNLKMGDSARKDALERQKAADILARDKMKAETDIETNRAIQKQNQWEAEYELKKQDIESRNKYNNARLAADKNKAATTETEKKGKPFYQVTYSGKTIDLDQAQYGKILSIVKSTHPELGNKIDINLMDAQMGNQNAKLALDQIVTEYWQINTETLQEGLRNSPYGAEGYYDNKPSSPGANVAKAPEQYPGAGIPGLQPLNPQATKSPMDFKDMEVKKYVKKGTNDILNDEYPEKGKRIKDLMHQNGFTRDQIKSQIDLILSKNYNLQ